MAERKRFRRSGVTYADWAGEAESAAFTSGVHAHKVSSMYTLNGAGIKVERGKRHRKNREENKYVIDVKMSPNVEKVLKIVSTSGKSWGRRRMFQQQKKRKSDSWGCVWEKLFIHKKRNAQRERERKEKRVTLCTQYGLTILHCAGKLEGNDGGQEMEGKYQVSVGRSLSCDFTKWSSPNSKFEDSLVRGPCARSRRGKICPSVVSKCSELR